MVVVSLKCEFQGHAAEIIAGMVIDMEIVVGTVDLVHVVAIQLIDVTDQEGLLSLYSFFILWYFASFLILASLVKFDI